MHPSLIAHCRRQDGVFTRAQAMAAGYSDGQLVRRVRAGQWLLLSPGLYRLTGAPVTWRSRAWSPLLSAGEGAVLSHAVAARIWQLDGAPAYELFDVSVPRSRRPRVTVGAAVHRTALRLTDVTRREGLPITTAERTAVDLARALPVDQGAGVLGDALRTGVAVTWRLERQLTCAAHRAGAGRARQAAALADPRLERGLEGELLRGLAPLGIVWAVQYEVRAANGLLVARLDLADPVSRLGVEADGYASHGLRPQFERDHERAGRLRLLGWQVVSFTAQQIRTEMPWVRQVVLSVRGQALAARRQL